MISVPFELEYVEFEVFIPGILLPEKSQKEGGLSFAILTDPFSFSYMHVYLWSLSSFVWPATASNSSRTCNTIFLQQHIRMSEKNQVWREDQLWRETR